MHTFDRPCAFIHSLMDDVAGPSNFQKCTCRADVPHCLKLMIYSLFIAMIIFMMGIQTRGIIISRSLIITVAVLCFGINALSATL